MEYIKFQQIYKDFPNLAILVKIAMPGKVQLTFSNDSGDNKSLEEEISIFSLTGSPEVTMVVSFNAA